MSDVASKFPAGNLSSTQQVDVLQAFEALCRSRAHRYKTGELDLHPAVDWLWDWAVGRGLPDRYGVDHLQYMMAIAFRNVGAEPPEPQEYSPPKRDGAAQSTYDAISWTLRVYGLAGEQGDIESLNRRIAQLSRQQLQRLAGELKNKVDDSVLHLIAGLLK